MLIPGLEKISAKDSYPIPQERELYYQGDDRGYWLSGYDDAMLITNRCSPPLIRCLDFGGCTGRIIRHFKCQLALDCWLCDVNQKYVDWATDNLPGINCFKSSHQPSLPIDDNFFDLVVASSVFTHIDSGDVVWIQELHRIIRPGGLLYVTVHTERTWNNIDSCPELKRWVVEHPDYGPQVSWANDKLHFRFDENDPYSTHSFYKRSYLEQNWSAYFQLEFDTKDPGPGGQEIIWARKPLL